MTTRGISARNIPMPRMIEGRRILRLTSGLRSMRRVGRGACAQLPDTASVATRLEFQVKEGEFGQVKVFDGNMKNRRIFLCGWNEMFKLKLKMSYLLKINFVHSNGVDVHVVYNFCWMPRMSHISGLLSKKYTRLRVTGK